jgi:cholest-4-en-3-one 26-monooxygenase
MTRDWASIDNRLLDPNWYASDAYHETFQMLRDEDPVHLSEDTHYGHPYWFVTRYDDIKELLFDPTRFSSRMATRVPRGGRRMTPEEKTALGFDINLAGTDDPVHNVYRRPINKHFSVPGVARLKADVAGYVDDLIADLADEREFDLVDRVCAELALRVILCLLGVPPEDWAHLKLAANRWATPADPRYTLDDDPVRTATIGNRDIAEYCIALAEKRRQDPQDDFATVVGNLEVDGDRLSIHEMRVYFFTMIAGGLESTRNAASVGLWSFLRNPAERARLVGDPSLVPSAVEEVVRWTSPVKQVLRIANDDIEFRGRHIRANDWVVLEVASANKDERVFAEPHRFDITRQPNDHLGLGTGIHACLGRALVRLELSTLFPKLLAAFPDLEVLDREAHWIPDIHGTGLATLTVRHDPAAVTA